MNINDMTIGGLLAGIGALLQLVPVFFSEIFIFTTPLSAFPIYFAAKKNIKMGFVVYICTALLVSIFSLHEALFFAFTNGIIGLSLGLARHKTGKKLFAGLFGAFVLTCSLCFINFLLGIPVFGTQLPGPIIYQIIFIFLFSFIYDTIFIFLADYLNKFLNKK